MDYDFQKLLEDPRFNTLTSGLVWDNAGGNASTLENKTSIWVVSGATIVRICNIAMSEVDDIDDKWLEVYLVRDVLESIPIRPNESKLLCMSELLAKQVKNKLFGASVYPCHNIKNNEKVVF